MIGLGESNAILWQSPSGAREWLHAGWRASSKSVMAMLGVGAGIAIGAGYTMAFYLRQREQLTQAVEPASDLAVFGIVTLFLIILLGVPALAITITGALFVPRLTLTADELHLAPRFPWRRMKKIARSKIRSVLIYEGGGTVVLLGDTGELLRARHVTKSADFADFAEALDAPTLAWPRHKSAKVVDLLFVLSAVAWSVLTIVASMPVSLSIHRLYEFAIDPIPQQGLHFSVIVFCYVAGMIMATPLTLILVTIIGRLFVSASLLTEFILFLRDNDRWHGHAPAGWSLVGSFLSTCIGLAARVARIPPPPPLQPELRYGMTPAMAAEALALAEGTG